MGKSETRQRKNELHSDGGFQAGRQSLLIIKLLWIGMILALESRPPPVTQQKGGQLADCGLPTYPVHP